MINQVVTEILFQLLVALKLKKCMFKFPIMKELTINHSLELYIISLNLYKRKKNRCHYQFFSVAKKTEYYINFNCLINSES